jgi:hypothetical protein
MLIEAESKNCHVGNMTHKCCEGGRERIKKISDREVRSEAFVITTYKIFT